MRLGCESVVPGRPQGGGGGGGAHKPANPCSLVSRSWHGYTLPVCHYLSSLLRQKLSIMQLVSVYREFIITGKMPEKASPAGPAAPSASPVVKPELGDTVAEVGAAAARTAADAAVDASDAAKNAAAAVAAAAGGRLRESECSWAFDVCHYAFCMLLPCYAAAHTAADSTFVDTSLPCISSQKTVLCDGRDCMQACCYACYATTERMARCSACSRHLARPPQPPPPPPAPRGTVWRSCLAEWGPLWAAQTRRRTSMQLRWRTTRSPQMLRRCSRAQRRRLRLWPSQCKWTSPSRRLPDLTCCGLRPRAGL